jgi:predicted nucleic acid-binding Zn ribbon protein
MIADSHLYTCPCGCKKPIPNGRYFASDRCRRAANKVGKYMPHRYEKKLRILKRKS